MLDIPYRRMLAVCFCCDCCCTVRYGLRVGPAAFRDIILRLPGLTLVVDDTCTSCGVCAAACPVQAITLEACSRDAGQESVPIAAAERAQVNAEQCKGCGRCVAVCPSASIHLHMADETDVVDRLLTRVAQRTDIFS
jgi:UDP-glucose 4-epimerase